MVGTLGNEGACINMCHDETRQCGRGKLVVEVEAVKDILLLSSRGELQWSATDGGDGGEGALDGVGGAS